MCKICLKESARHTTSASKYIGPKGKPDGAGKKRSERKARRCGKKKRKRDKQERNNNMTITNMYVEEKEDRIPLYELTVGGRRSLKDYEITDFYAVCLNNTSGEEVLKVNFGTVPKRSALATHQYLGHLTETSVGDYLTGVYDAKYYPGQITQIYKNGAVVNVMGPYGKHWQWPYLKDIKMEQL
ncbi:hypothetical protein QE152_g24408 [Popillia japonica]|uniref:Uncharacterized protein n=1 Tax=Popillia japonica TaxID=7064 RepID=A0AAW1KFX6_POPJA